MKLGRVDFDSPIDILHLNRTQNLGELKDKKPEFANFFRSLNQSDINWILKRFEVKKIPGGARVFSQGDYGDYMMIVVSGAFRTFIKIRKRSIQVSTLASGDTLGEIAVINGDRYRVVTAVAAVDSEIIFISQQAFFKMMKQNKKLAAKLSYNLVGLLSHRLRISTQQLINQE